MSQPTKQVTLALERADKALVTLKNAIAKQLHADDRKNLDQLIELARRALDSASSHLSDARHDAETALDRL